MIAIERLKTLGYTFSVRDYGAIIYQFHGIQPPPQEAVALLAEVQRQKTAAAVYLNITWPPESAESERKFGPGVPRLYPFINKLVMTPLGEGRLWQACDRAGVILLKKPDIVTFLPWTDVWPIAGQKEE